MLKLITGERVIRGNDDSIVSRFPSGLRWRRCLRASTSVSSTSSNGCRRFVSRVSLRPRVILEYQFQDARGERDEGNKVNVMAKVLLSTTRNAEPEERNVRAHWRTRCSRRALKESLFARSDKESAPARP